MPKGPDYQEIEGLIIPKAFSPKCLRDSLRYKPKDNDVFIVTFPKCGTTWVQHIVINILKRGLPPESFEEFQRLSPFMELTGTGIVETMPRPGAIKTHLPFNMQPYSLQAKYIYVTRNPFDCCVSLFHHSRTLPVYQYSDGTFEDFFEIFINGETEFGDYFDHLLSWYEHRNDPNVLFLVYEKIKADTRAAVLKIAKFLGQEYEDMLVKDEQMMENIIRQTSVEYMKKSTNKHFGSFFGSVHSDEEIDNENIPEGLKHVLKYMKSINFKPQSEFTFVRKGIVGDWKNHFTQKQRERLKRKCIEKFKGTEIPEFWPDILK
ncbi:sulfotransferase ssu-1-like [Tachypleus tridentatus]|uniref:sulfotransferase ssu-1-like n=1 Tax=Tachypleus tridentatus TaxID=6853 RepID=UPI003FD4D16D